MDQNQFQTSFIPKKPIAPVRASSSRPGASMLSLFSVVILIASIAGAVFVYVSRAGLERSLIGMKENLESAESAFESEFIADISELDRRIQTAGVVLQNHIAVSPIFEALQKLTLKSVQFNKFSHSVSQKSGEMIVSVSMSGKTDEYESLALQSDSLTKNKYIKDPVFSNLTLDDKGNVLFDLTFTVDPIMVSYGESVSRLPATTPLNNDNVSDEVVDAFNINEENL